jgi:hypothetical protein
MCAFEALMVGKAFLQCRIFPVEQSREGHRRGYKLPQSGYGHELRGKVA